MNRPPSGAQHQAAAWLMALEENPIQVDTQAFVAWLRASPEHVREFLIASAVLHELEYSVGPRR